MILAFDFKDFQALPIELFKKYTRRMLMTIRDNLERGILNGDIEIALS